MSEWEAQQVQYKLVCTVTVVAVAVVLLHSSYRSNTDHEIFVYRTIYLTLLYEFTYETLLSQSLSQSLSISLRPFPRYRSFSS